MADTDETLALSSKGRDIATSTSVGAAGSRFVALEEIGRGGMGRVVRAYDPRLQREVALKEVRRDRMDDEAATRLVAEARAMAKLSHPHVVAVYDVEEQPAGEIVLVMEYVAGTTLGGWLRAGERSWQDVIRCYADAGRGLQAAHDAGLLHRDFKPTNVLVSEHGLVKVTDFGVAKAASSSPSDLSSMDEDASADLTEAGTVLGTPRYMAPEQHRGDSLTPAADQYAFCVALWQALCGEPPFFGDDMAKAKLAGPPPWTTASTPRAIAAAITRGLAPRPEDRWPSMNALLQALSWDPVRRRNRWLLGLGSIGTLAMAGLGYQGWADVRSEQCGGAERRLAGVWDDDTRADVRSAFGAVGKSYADQAWVRTGGALDAYASDWASMHTETCEATTVRREQSPEMMDLRMGCLREAAVELEAAVGVLADADDSVIQKADQVLAGLRPLSRCADTEALRAAVAPPGAQDAQAVDDARGHLARADSLMNAGRYAQAEDAVEAAKQTSMGADYEPLFADVTYLEGRVLEELGRYEAAEAKLGEAMRLASQWKLHRVMQEATTQWMFVVGVQQQRMDDALRLRPIAEGLSQDDPLAEAGFRDVLASLLDAQGRYDEAEAEFRTVLTLVVGALGPDHLEVAGCRSSLAAALDRQGRYDEAEAEYRTALALRVAALSPDHPEVANLRNDLGVVLDNQGKHADAEAEYRAALAVRQAALPPDHPHIAMSRNNIGGVLSKQGKKAEAEVEYRAALALRVGVLGSEHPHVGESHSNIGTILLDQGRYADAETEFRAALSVLEAALGPAHAHVGMTRTNLAHALEKKGELQAAEAELRGALATLTAAVGSEHPWVASAHNNLAGLLSAQGKDDEAQGQYRVALEVRLAALAPDHPSVAKSRHNLANHLRVQGRSADALPLAEQAWTRRQQDDVPPSTRAETAFVLARVLWAIRGPDRDRPRARRLAADALASYRKAGEEYEDTVAFVDLWLREHPAP